MFLFFCANDVYDSILKTARLVGSCLFFAFSSLCEGKAQENPLKKNHEHTFTYQQLIHNKYNHSANFPTQIRCNHVPLAISTRPFLRQIDSNLDAEWTYPSIQGHVIRRHADESLETSTQTNMDRLSRYRY